MSESLIRRSLEKSLSTKSLSDLVRIRSSSSAEVWMLLDASGSMEGTMRNGKRLIDGLCEVVQGVQSKRPVKMIVFSNNEASVTSRAPQHPRGGTPLDKAILLAKRLEVGRCIVVSDGVPDSREQAMSAARDFGGQIDVVYVGDPGDSGEEFLRALAASTGGTEFHGDLSQPKELSKGIIGLITAGTDEEEEEED